MTTSYKISSFIYSFRSLRVSKTALSNDRISLIEEIVTKTYPSGDENFVVFFFK